ncbi:anthranilate synthase [Leifsonia xyli subsp. xyli]|uniref:Anthranilate synthase component I n=2 Tax=Leifsonia xyli subsp. xyli TaxID=59736 RepID=Q6AEW3_LEIXX|nr:anthranilate synthase component I family protein [Leifsonia xyli]AAT89082.1 anthranilate synthase component I [Leifsonia xyli subsp. xyli str. CTCB07]ODA90754.1 anthranilate synthase [Leifsonia xyli subsp. xyli]
MLLPPRVHHLNAPVDPADAFAALYPAGDAVWLDSGPDAAAGMSVIGTGTRVATASVADGTVTVDGETRTGSIVEVLRATGRADTAGYPLGWIGWLGYEAGAADLGLPHAPGEGQDAAFVWADRLIVFDHDTGRVTLVDARDGGADPEPAGGESSAGGASDSAPASSAPPWLRATAAALTAPAAAGSAARHLAAHPLPGPRAQAGWRYGPAAYRALLDACQSAIHAGDAYQLCLTNTATAQTSADPLAVHLRLRRESPAPHAGFLRIGGETLVSSSPEQFLRVEPDGRVRTKPIKGTRPRGTTPAEDRRLRAELEASEKERAENVMIVDLMRNDLARVCETGSVEVRHLLAVESYAQVHQLVSTVEGRLRDGQGVLDALAACFPAGSMTGAPKLSAMRILNRLEQGPRGVYAGCFGALAADGSADLAMVIRSVQFRGSVATIGSGGGITALSVPDEELAEVGVKAAALLRAAGLDGAGNGQDLPNV